MLRSEYYLNETDDKCREALRLYREILAQSARLLGAKDPERDVEEVIDFEIQFANVRVETFRSRFAANHR